MKKLHILSFLFSIAVASINQNAFMGQDITQEYAKNNIACSQPTNVSHTSSLTTCNILWDEMPQASKYDISYRIKGTTEWDRVGSYNHYVTIKNLVPNTIYQYMVRSYCGTWDFANATSIREFNTTDISTTQSELSGHETGITSITPKNDVLDVEFSTEAKSNVELSINDLKGNLVYQNNIDNANGSQSKAIDVSSLEEGAYTIVMKSADKRMAKKFVVIR